eukprot:TCONS_00057645-protein
MHQRIYKSRKGNVFIAASCSSYTNSTREREKDMYSDFVDFKIYVTETLSALNEKVIKMDSTLELKDTVINLLQQQLNTSQENLKIALDNNAQLIKTFSLSKNTIENVPVLNKDHEKVDKDINEIVNEIPLDSSINNDISITQPNDFYTYENQTSRFRQKM